MEDITAPTIRPIMTAKNTSIEVTVAGVNFPSSKIFIVISAGSIHCIMKYDATRVSIILAQLPIFYAFCTADSLASLSLTFTKKVPMMEKMIPMPAITTGNNIGPNPPKLSLMLPPISLIT